MDWGIRFSFIHETNSFSVSLACVITAIRLPARSTAESLIEEIYNSVSVTESDIVLIGTIID